MNYLDRLLELTERYRASDLHITFGSPPKIRVNKELVSLSESPVNDDILFELYNSFVSDKHKRTFEKTGDCDFAHSSKSGTRYRVNAYRQKGRYAFALRRLNNSIPSLEDLSLPATLGDLCMKEQGLIIVTGPTGSGKSTSLASMIDVINHKRRGHIVTIEDPIEYIHQHRSCIVNQRELGEDTISFAKSLRAALRQDPDVILVGEMRDLETITTALVAAETGHLVFSTLHTMGSAKTIDRIVDVFPPDQQQQIRVQLANVLIAVISQRLLPNAQHNGLLPALEIMIANNAIRNLIREGKTHQINNMIQTNAGLGMRTFNQYLTQMNQSGKIDRETFERFFMD